MSRVICVDVDNTLADYTGGLRDYVHSRYGDEYPCPAPIAYDFHKTPGWPFSGSPTEFLQWHKDAVDHGLYFDETPYEGAAEALTTLRDHGWRIIVATARVDDYDGDTRRWLDRHGIPYDGLFYGDKLDVNFDILVDDRPATLTRAVADGRDAIRFDHAYNRDITGCTVIHRWNDAVGTIERIMADRRRDDSLQSLWRKALRGEDGVR